MDSGPTIDDLILVTPPSRDIERDAVAAAWSARGGEVLRVDRFWDPPEVDTSKVRIYGPHTFALVLQEVWPIELVSPPDELVLGLEEPHLGRRIGCCRLDEVGDLSFPVFAKPLVSKLFEAAVHDDPAALARETDGLDADTAIIWSDPTPFSSEVRIFALGRAVHGAAAYEGSVPDLAGAVDRATQVLQVIRYDGPLVIDVGEISPGTWAVIEFNEAWGAGLNGCEADRCLPVIAAATAPTTDSA